MNATGAQTGSTAHVDIPDSRFDELVDEWVRDQVISDAQAQRMHADVHSARVAAVQHRRRAASIAVEVLGYLGSVIIVVALSLLVSQVWDQIPVVVIAAVALALTAALIAAGSLLPATRSDVAARLRSVLYVVACVTFGGAAAVIAGEYLNARDVPLVAFAAATVIAAALWFTLRAPLQHVAFFVSALITTGLAVEWLMPAAPQMWTDDLRPAVLIMPALAIWGFGVVWVMLSWANITRPAELGRVLGAVAVVSGILSAGPENLVIFLGLASLVALALLAFYVRDVGVLIVAAIGTLLMLPMAITRLFPGQLPAAVVLLLVGAALVLGAIFIARHRNQFAQTHTEREVAPLPLPVALTVSVTVWVVLIVVMALVAAAAM